MISYTNSPYYFADNPKLLNTPVLNIEEGGAKNDSSVDISLQTNLRKTSDFLPVHVANCTPSDLIHHLFNVPKMTSLKLVFDFHLIECVLSIRGYLQDETDGSPDFDIVYNDSSISTLMSTLEFVIVEKLEALVIFAPQELFEEAKQEQLHITVQQLCNDTGTSDI